MDVMEEKLTMLLNGCLKTMSQMKLAQFIELEVMITDKSALQWQFVKTVCQMNHALFQILIMFIELKSMVLFQVKKIWCKKFIKEVQLLAVLQYLMLLKITQAEFLLIPLEIWILFMIFQLLVGELTTEQNIGLSEILGEVTTEKVDL